MTRAAKLIIDYRRAVAAYLLGEPRHASAQLFAVEKAYLELYNYVRDLEEKLRRATDLIEDKSR